MAQEIIIPIIPENDAHRDALVVALSQLVICEERPSAPLKEVRVNDDCVWNQHRANLEALYRARKVHGGEKGAIRAAEYVALLQSVGVTAIGAVVQVPDGEIPDIGGLKSQIFAFRKQTLTYVPEVT